MIIVLLALLFVDVVSARMRHDHTLQQAFASTAPSPVYRAKITVQGTKQIMDVRFSATQVFDIYQFHVRWGEPFQWNDEDAPASGGQRHFDLHCWVRDMENGDQKVIFSRQIDATINGYHEKLRFPPGRDLRLQCEVRGVNAAGLSTAWVPTNWVDAKDVPIYFPGVPGVDLRGLTTEDLLSVIAKIGQAAGDSHDYADEPAAASANTDAK